jgi:hypothetical protein
VKKRWCSHDVDRRRADFQDRGSTGGGKERLSICHALVHPKIFNTQDSTYLSIVRDSISTAQTYHLPSRSVRQIPLHQLWPLQRGASVRTASHSRPANNTDAPPSAPNHLVSPLPLSYSLYTLVQLFLYKVVPLTSSKHLRPAREVPPSDPRVPQSRLDCTEAVASLTNPLNPRLRNNATARQAG